MVSILSEKIMENFVPESESVIPEMTSLDDREGQLDSYAGHYQTAHLPSQDFFKLEAMLNNVNVKDNGDGTLQIGSGTYHEVEPLVFQNVESPASIVVFMENDSDEIEFLTFGGTGSYLKAPWYQTMNFRIGLVAVITLASLSMAVLWPFTRQGHWIVWVISFLNLGMLAGVAILLSGTADLLVLFKTIPFGGRLLMMLPWLIGILALGLLVFLVKIWKDRAASWWGKVHYSLVTLASIALVWAANFWNLILK